jgi:anthranilate phosphoribosyltransferase
MTNPAGATRQLIGVYDRTLVVPIAEALARLGANRAMVAHGLDGLDELTLATDSIVADVNDGVVREWRVDPQTLGLVQVDAGLLQVESVEGSVQAIRAIMSADAPSTKITLADHGRRDIVLLNAGAALLVAGAAGDLAEGVELARASIDSGGALDALQTLVRVSNAG